MIPTEYLYFILLALILVGFAIAVIAYFGGFNEASNIVPSIGKAFSTGG